MLGLVALFLPADHPLTGVILMWYGILLLDGDRPGDAEPLLRRALTIQNSAFPDGHWKVVGAEIALARCLSILGLREEAQKILVGADVGLSWQSHTDRTAALTMTFALFESWGWQEKAAEVRALMDGLATTGPG